MANFKITVEYDGTAYNGWQIQKNTDETIQNYLEKAATRLNKKPVRVQGAGRTDAGVHALGQVASFQLDVDIPVQKIPLALNSELPSDIICHRAEKVPADFHARYDARGKKYCYRITNNRFPSAFNLRFVYNIYRALDIEKMKRNIKQLEGRHDFAAFSASDAEVSDTIRTIKNIDFSSRKTVYPARGKEYLLTIEGDGFLYNMVRIIAGSLIEVGLGKMEPEYQQILATKDRQLAGYTAPAKALTLVEVYY